MIYIRKDELMGMLDDQIKDAETKAKGIELFVAQKIVDCIKDLIATLPEYDIEEVADSG